MEPNKKVRETTVRDGNTTQTTQEVVDPNAEQHEARRESRHKQNVVVNVIWFLDGVLTILLGLRFLFSLLGANPANGFANFIYSASHPFVSPFFNLFSYNWQAGVRHFEIYTLVAIVVYALIAWGLAKLATINRD